ncbi:membrane protein [Thiomicrospira aerophila AL3]|uniref:Membrane protein n=1 Tax=Thiomicrospira aerophila AL3 TaxID=717772 RepID=W0DT73_9GAMM|nr:LrgB family protein [Thiomicrospira aerophila]AHF01805.1 membrane protein [Thiomicrospira aerophila AL3]
MDAFDDIWVYLAASPLFGLVLTLVVFQAVYSLYSRAHYNPMLNPVAMSVLVIITVLWLSGMSYEHYFEGAQFIHFLLGPATVALAIPLYQHWATLRSLWIPILFATSIGLIAAGLSAFWIAQWLGASMETLLSLVPKSVTAPVAMGIAEKNGGIATLTAAFVVITGVLGAMLGPWVFKLMKLKDDRVAGIAMGVTAHGLGTAKSFQISVQMGAFSGLAMALSAFIAAIILPWLMASL